MKNKLSCIIVEDLPTAANFLNRFCSQSGLLDVEGIFPDVSTALRFLDQRTVDVIFLDVEMPGGTGFELMDKLTFSPKVILTTSKTEYAYNAFEYYVTDFLKKPFTYKRFLEAVEKVSPPEPAAPAAPAYKDHLFIKVDQKLVKLASEDILYIESMGDYVRFVTPQKKFTNLNTMKNLEERLDPQIFIKVHRSYIVNINKIDDLQGNVIYIQKQEVPIGKAHRDQVMQRLNII